MAEQDWKKRLGVVYSTNPDFNYQTEEAEQEETLPAEKQKLIVKIDRRHRAGKQVTLIEGFVGTGDDLAALAKDLGADCEIGEYAVNVRNELAARKSGNRI